jgi:diguanylate cyclase (GGDEF)-like protein
MQAMTVAPRSIADATRETVPTVLIVDDDQAVLDSLARILRRQFALLTASSARDALAVLEANKIGVLVVDMSMPAMNGLELLDVMRSNHPDVVPIMLTGRLDQQTATDAINKGHVFRFLSKPCQSDEIKGAITDAILQHRLQTARRELVVKTETLEAAFSAMHDGVCIVEPGAQITTINHQAIGLLGLEQGAMEQYLPAAFVCRGEEIREVAFNDHLLQVSSTTLSTGRQLVVLHDVTAVRQLEQQLRLEATTDPLTQLANRRRFLEAAAEEQARAQRYDRPMSILMFDVDFFKKINDRYGHTSGDDVLRRIAVVLTAGIRSTDLVARFGGEEFIVLLAESDVIESAVIGDRLRLAIAAELVETVAGVVSVTASVGAATAIGAGVDVKQLISRADAALYAAKRNGRNRMECAPGIPI